MDVEESSSCADASDASTVTEGFWGRNPANQIEQFGVIVHVYLTYESRSRVEEEKPKARGIKSFELVNSAWRWHIIQVVLGFGTV
jgi:hypothetical protein